MKRPVATILVALAAVVAPPVAGAGLKPLSAGQVQARTDKVRAQEKQNKFHIRSLIGGPFKVRAAHCQGGDPFAARCGYDVEGRQATEPGGSFRRACKVIVRVKKSPATGRITHQRLKPTCADVGIPG